MALSDWFVPLFFGLTLFFSFGQGLPIFDLFVEGATEGLKTALKLSPYIIAMCVLIAMLRSSGVLDAVAFLLTPAATFAGIPPETLPLALLRPLSGSGSLSLLQEIFMKYGPDSLIGRTASVIMSASDTIFYILTLYFGCVGIKKVRYTVICALFAALCGTLAAGLLCRLFFL